MMMKLISLNNRYKFVFLGIAGVLFQFAESSATTVKTNHTDVNLWTTPGRASGTTIESIKKFEEVQVLATKKTENGETWFKVQLRRFSEGKKVETVGWVDAKFFNEIENPVDADQPSATATEAAAPCVSCLRGSSEMGINAKNMQNLREIGKATERSSNFIWPVGGYVRSGYGYRRHPIKRVVKLHRGTDISGNAGARVKASKGGTIEVSVNNCKAGRRSCNGGAGNLIVINHGDGTKTRYMHLSQSCRLPPRGSRVSQGDLIGCVGATGAVTGPHLHFEVIKNGRFINPLTVLPKRAKK